MNEMTLVFMRRYDLRPTVDENEVYIRKNNTFIRIIDDKCIFQKHV